MSGKWLPFCINVLKQEKIYEDHTLKVYYSACHSRHYDRHQGSDDTAWYAVKCIQFIVA